MLAPWLLRAFGSQYVAALPVFRILLITCLPRALVTIYFGFNRIMQRTHRSAYLQATISLLSIAAALTLSQQHGLLGVAWALLVIQTGACAVALSGLQSARSQGRASTL